MVRSVVLGGIVTAVLTLTIMITSLDDLGPTLPLSDLADLLSGDEGTLINMTDRALLYRDLAHHLLREVGALGLEDLVTHRLRHVSTALCCHLDSLHLLHVRADLSVDLLTDLGRGVGVGAVAGLHSLALHGGDVSADGVHNVVLHRDRDHLTDAPADLLALLRGNILAHHLGKLGTALLGNVIADFLLEILTHLCGDSCAGLLRLVLTGHTLDRLALLHLDRLALGLGLLTLLLLLVLALHGRHLHALLGEGQLFTDSLHHLPTLSAGDLPALRPLDLLTLLDWSLEADLLVDWRAVLDGVSDRAVLHLLHPALPLRDGPALPLQPGLVTHHPQLLVTLPGRDNTTLLHTLLPALLLLLRPAHLPAHVLTVGLHLLPALLHRHLGAGGHLLVQSLAPRLLCGATLPDSDTPVL